MSGAIPRTACPIQSWKQPVDCTTFETRTVSGGSRTKEKPYSGKSLIMGNGINPNHWWAKGAGDDMELSKSLQPLTTLRRKLMVVSGLFNKHATGVGIHPGQTG